MKPMSVWQCLVIKQIIRLVYKLFVKYFTLSKSRFLNGQLSVRKAEHRLCRSCAKLVRRDKNCEIVEKCQNCTNIALYKIAIF